MSSIGDPTRLLTVRQALIEAAVEFGRVDAKAHFGPRRRFAPEVHVRFERSAVLALAQALERGSLRHPGEFDRTPGAELAARRMEIILLAAFADAQRKPTRFLIENPEPVVSFDEIDPRLRHLADPPGTTFEGRAAVRIEGTNIKYVVRQLCPGFWPFC